MSENNLNMIRRLLEESAADGWEITSSEKECWEFYFISHFLDQNRVRQVQHTNVKVFRKSEDGQFLGSASGEIHPTASEQEARDMIDRLLRQAALVRNPYYELRKPSDTAPNAIADGVDILRIAGSFLETMNSIEETDSEYINSYEIFVSGINRRFMSSTGIDVTSSFPYSMVEVVVNASDGAEEIELYRMYTSGSCDERALMKDLEETMRYGRDRLQTVPTPAIGSAAVLFSTEAATQIYQYFIDRMSTAFVYQQISDWKIGDTVAECGAGDALTIRAVKELPNSSANMDYDPEGAPVRDMVLIDKNMAANYWGGRQFSQYLGIEDCFIAGNFVVGGGTVLSDDLRTGDYLEVVEFSDFQVNSMTGDIAGEIRLGYWHHDGEVQIVSGGSVSGSMHDMAGKLRFSADFRQYDNMLIPALTRLDALNITGAEN